MQINSVHLPTLAQYGISQGTLMEPCKNVYIAAWHLRRQMNKYGNTWQAVGAYHSETPALRDKYAQHVRVVTPRPAKLSRSRPPRPSSSRLVRRSKTQSTNAKQITARQLTPANGGFFFVWNYCLAVTGVAAKQLREAQRPRRLNRGDARFRRGHGRRDHDDRGHGRLRRNPMPGTDRRIVATLAVPPRIPLR